MDYEDALIYFEKNLIDDPQIPTAIAAMNTLLAFLKNTPVETMAELQKKLTELIVLLTSKNLASSVASGCELFLRFITLTTFDQTEFQVCRSILIRRGDEFVRKASSSRSKIASLAYKYISNGSSILVHSRSRTVLALLIEACRNKRIFSVYLTQSSPDFSGDLMKKELLAAGIPTTLIIDSAVGFIMERVDFVLLGAEAVVESGGIINKIGSYQVSIVACAHGRPVYVVAESYKFLRLYPLSQMEVPNETKYVDYKNINSDGSVQDYHPLVDYTPPHFITLLMTDLGIFTPSAVSDELIKLYL